jgi:L-threonylcarbamoyladenylate synthase
MTQITRDIDLAVSALNAGKLLVIPTETVYGLAANAFDEQGVLEIYKIKGRPSNNPLIVHLARIEDLSKVAKNIPQKALKLAQAFWPGPLTLILKKQEYISDLVSANLPTIAVRIPAHPMTLQLLAKIDFPLVAPSANRSNHISPTQPEHVLNSLGAKCPLVLDGGPCSAGIESTILGFKDDQVILFRKGIITQTEIEEFLHEQILDFSTLQEQGISPGSSKKHYAPRTPLLLVNDLNEFNPPEGKRIGALFFGEKHVNQAFEVLRNLSQTGNFEEAATRIYRELYFLDDQNLDLIVVEILPELGLGSSINDRLRRSASS